MGIRALVVVAVWIWIADLAEDDHAGWAAINTKRTTCAYVVVDSEDDMVGWVEAGLFGADGLVDCRWGHHKDALPRADIDTAFAHDALGLIDVNELFWLNRGGQPCRVDLLEDIVVPKFGHRGICVGDRHLPSSLANERTTEL